MELTDKAKTKFEEWLYNLKIKNEIYDNLDSNSNIKWNDFPKSMQYGVYIDFFRGNGMYLNNCPYYVSEGHVRGFEPTIYFDGKPAVTIYEDGDVFECPKNAELKLIEKANDLLNERL